MAQGIKIQPIELPSDKELYPRLMAHDKKAWADFQQCYRARLQIYFKKRQELLDEDLDDLIQNTFKLFFHTLILEKYNPHLGNLAQWLYGIAGIQLKKYRAKGSRSKNWVELRDDFPDEESHYDKNSYEEDNATSLSNQDESRLNSALEQLSIKIRDVVTLKISRSESCTWEDIAEELGISVSAAKMRYHRGIDQLKNLLT